MLGAWPGTASVRAGCPCDLRLVAGRRGVPAYLHARHLHTEFMVRRPAVVTVRMS